MQNSRHIKVLSALVIAAAALITVFAHAGAPDQREVKFRMEWIPSGMYAPFYLASSAGFYTTRGLHVQMLSGNGGLAAIEEVTAAHADFGMASCDGLALSISAGRPVVSVAQYIAKSTWAFFVPKGSGITSIKELADKRVVVSPNSSELVMLLAIEDLSGIRKGSIHPVVADPSQKIAIYGRQQADTIVTSVPYAGPLVDAARPSDILLWSDAGYVMPDLCIFTRKEVLKKDPVLIQRFLAGTFQGIAEAEKDPAAAIDRTMAANQFLQRDQTATQWRLTTQFLQSNNSGNCPIGWHSPKDWSAGLEMLQKYEGLTGNIADMDQFYTNRFIPPCN